MIDVEQLAELPTKLRMSWSARPTWNRRPPVDLRRNYQSNLGGTRGHHARHNGADRHGDRAALLARPNTLVIAFPISWEEHHE